MQDKIDANIRLRNALVEEHALRLKDIEDNISSLQLSAREEEYSEL